MKTSKDGIDLIIKFEGLRLKSYLCPAQVYTVGFGHTGSDVGPTTVITKEKAVELLKRDLERFEACISSSVVWPISQAQFDALVALAFNIGASAFCRSTLLRYLNQGNVLEAYRQFSVWNKVGHEICAGLTKRRLAESELFLRGMDHG
jgi:lysozyme